MIILTMQQNINISKANDVLTTWCLENRLKCMLRTEFDKLLTTASSAWRDHLHPTLTLSKTVLLTSVNCFMLKLKQKCPMTTVPSILICQNGLHPQLSSEKTIHRANQTVQRQNCPGSLAFFSNCSIPYATSLAQHFFSRHLPWNLQHNDKNMSYCVG